MNVYLILALAAAASASVCIAVFGLSRSAAHTHASFDRYILRPLRAHNIDYFVYFHTWLPQATTYNNFWSGEIGLNLSATDYLHFPANRLQVELETPLDISSYSIHGDPWREKVLKRGGAQSEQLQHILYALISMYRVTQMWKGDSMCKTVLYVRPDSLFIEELDVTWLATQEVLTPNFSQWPINDRFAIGPAAKMIVYGERLLQAEHYAQRHPLHTEKFLAYIFQLNNWSMDNCIDFCFFRTRANGLVVPEIGAACEEHVIRYKDTLSWVPALFRPPKYKNM
jgi:hypothetical protein